MRSGPTFVSKLQSRSVVCEPVPWSVPRFA
jgi:hypothetical protein